MPQYDETLADSFNSGDLSAVYSVVVLVAEQLGWTELYDPLAAANGRLVDTASFGEVVSTVYPYLLQENFQVNELLGELRTYYGRLSSGLSLDETLVNQIAITEVLAVTLALNDLVPRIDRLQDVLQFNEAVAELTKTYYALAESLVADDTASYQLTAVAALTDSVEAADALTESAAVDQVLTDGFNFVLYDASGQSVYTAWVMNTQTRAVTEYENFVFNSFAKINKEYYAANRIGIYKLTGATDAGASIGTTIRTKLFEFYKQQKTRVEDAYIGVSAEGKLVVKTIDDAGTERWYKAQQFTTVDTQRVKLGRGVSSHYWQFELITEDGDDLELQSIEFRPVALKRRI